MATPEEAKLHHFLQWLQLNRVELRGCRIKYSDSTKGFGIFSSNHASDGILLVVPLDLAITPMRVLQDPLLGPECRAMFEEGEVDDRLLITLFLTVEHLRENSSWKPYFDLLPTTFGNPLWFSDDELLELKGTTLYRATQLQRKTLQSLFDEKVKRLAEKLLILDGHPERDVKFEDFLWANSIFWGRALNIPFPHCYVFPVDSEGQGSDVSRETVNSGTLSNGCDSLSNGESGKVPEYDELQDKVASAASISQGEIVWVEGLVPGIDFCNHDFRAAATWEVDGTGATTGVPFSMYLLSAGENPSTIEKEISISYGNKGNEELLYLYGFVMNDNPDDYLMVHYPAEAIQKVDFSESKTQLLEAQKAELRCLLPRSLLNRGFFPPSNSSVEGKDKSVSSQVSNYSWSGQRRTPSYLHKLVFPADFLNALRTLAMKENELYHVSSLLEELVGSGGERQPTDTEVQAAIWEACGDSGALQLLVDLLNMKMLDLKEGSGTENNDTELLEKALTAETSEDCREASGIAPIHLLSRNKRSSIIYRRGQKQLTRLFLKEAEHALQLALTEEL
ncbi:actin-histidine N-methyltransferase [Capsicum chacoense]